MPTFKVTYKSTVDGDNYNVCVTEDTSARARYSVIADYWDVEEIIECRQISSD